ncbi:hypothetical protein ACFTZB_07615 [Rhodococcus sp. NPDC057014]|uniref:hypothetical protein n=1 Tax=Rhodococcus sp. NPDC057014 TaxID=3346000 RepID=UPI0036345394
MHEVDFFTTLVTAEGGTVPGDRQIDGMDMSSFLLGTDENSGRDMVLYLQGNRLQAVKWHQWKVHLFEQDDFYSTWAPTNVPILYNLEPVAAGGRRIPQVARRRAAHPTGHTRPVRATRTR